MAACMEALIPVICQEVLLLRDDGVPYIQFDDTAIDRMYDTIRGGGAFMPDYFGQVGYAVDTLNRVIEGIDDVHLSLHLCGKRPLDESGEMSGDNALLSGIKALNVDMLKFELSEATDDDIALLDELPSVWMSASAACIRRRRV